MPQSNTAKVLIIQGEEFNREFFLSCLRGAGHEVHEKRTSGEGLKFSAESKPDLIVAGLKLDDINGMELCRRIKASPVTAGVAVVLTSNLFARSHTRAEAL